MLTGPLENALNRALPRSPRAQQLCTELAGRSIDIEIPNVARIVMESTGHSLHLTLRRAQYREPATDQQEATDRRAADAQIVGGPLSLLALAGPTPQAVLQRGGVQIRGDAGVAEKFRELGVLLRPDMEEELSRVVGDAPAHQIGRFARLAFSWGRETADTTVHNFAEYFAHEKRDLVSRNEGEQFLRGVDTLREDVDRLEARLDLLTRS